MSMTSIEKNGYEVILQEAHYLPRADEWEGASNSRAMGFDAVDCFKKISYQNNQVLETSIPSQRSENRETLLLSASHGFRDLGNQAADFLIHTSLGENSIHENSSTLMLRSEDSNTIRETSSHNHQIDPVLGAYNNSYHAVKPQDMVQEPQRQTTNFPHPVINLGDILDLCQFAEIDSDLLLSAYTKLRDTNDQMDSFSFIGDWINANEVKSNTITKVVMRFGGAIRNNHNFCSGLKGDCENLEIMYFDSQKSLQENRKTIAALEEGINWLKIQVGEMKEALGASNELAFECRASIQRILGELSQMWLVAKETRELTETKYQANFRRV